MLKFNPIFTNLLIHNVEVHALVKDDADGRQYEKFTLNKVRMVVNTDYRRGGEVSTGDNLGASARLIVDIEKSFMIDENGDYADLVLFQPQSKIIFDGREYLVKRYNIRDTTEALHHWTYLLQ